MKVNSLTAVSTQESCIPAANHARDSMALFLGSGDLTSTDSMCVKCETENNDISAPRMIILTTEKVCFFYHPANHNRSHQTGTIKRYSVRWGTDTDRSTTNSIIRSSHSTGWPGELSQARLSPSTGSPHKPVTAVSSHIGMGVKYSNSGW